MDEKANDLAYLRKKISDLITEVAEQESENKRLRELLAVESIKSGKYKSKLKRESMCEVIAEMIDFLQHERR